MQNSCSNSKSMFRPHTQFTNVQKHKDLHTLTNRKYKYFKWTITKAEDVTSYLRKQKRMIFDSWFIFHLCIWCNSLRSSLTTQHLLWNTEPSNLRRYVQNSRQTSEVTCGEEWKPWLEICGPSALVTAPAHPFTTWLAFSGLSSLWSCRRGGLIWECTQFNTPAGEVPVRAKENSSLLG